MYKSNSLAVGSCGRNILGVVCNSVALLVTFVKAVKSELEGKSCGMLAWRFLYGMVFR